jgi:methylglutaconyl-CoA hydratase
MDAFEKAGADSAVRVVVLAASGTVFSAGGDLTWMRRMAGASREENLADARSLARLLQAIDLCPKATVARVQGSAFGGALGLIAACDVAIAVADAQFAASEVRLGLIPAVISPYVVRAVGPRAARRLFVTAERIDAAEAQRIGLVHQVVPPAGLDAAIDTTVALCLAGGPEAIAAAKRLLGKVGGAIGHDVTTATVEALADVRAGAEAKEGIAAFFAKRRPRWAE